MSATSHVFFDSSLDMDSLAEELTHILEAEVIRSPNSIAPYVFIFEAANLKCFLGRSAYQLNDLSQQTYRFELYVVPMGVEADERGDALIEGAKYVFDKLKATGRFPVMAVFNLERVLVEFIPKV